MPLCHNFHGKVAEQNQPMERLAEDRLIQRAKRIKRWFLALALVKWFHSKELQK
jgi:hypothetical protein